MAKDHIVAVDVGLSFCKAVPVEVDGKVAGADGAPTPVRNPGPGQGKRAKNEREIGGPLGSHLHYEL